MILCFYSKVEFKELSISILEEIDLSTDKLFVIDVKCKRLNIVRKPITIGNDKPVKLAEAYLRNYLGGLYWHSNYTNWRKYYFEFCERNELT